MENNNAKKILIGLSVISMIGLVGCSNTNDSKQSEKYHDEQMAIINDMNNTKETGMAEEVKSYDEYGTGEDSNESEMDKCLKDLKFEKYDEKSTIKYYKCEATNTTYKDYSGLSLKAELLDDNGETIRMIPVLGVDGGWKAGETKELTFSTIENFANIKMHYEEY